MGSLYLNETVEKLLKRINNDDPNISLHLVNFLLYKDSNFIRLNVRKKFIKRLMEFKNFDKSKLNQFKDDLLQEIIDVEADLRHYKKISPIKFTIIKNIKRELVYEVNLINKIINKELTYKHEDLIKILRD